jgi:hypothetical protein
MKAPAWKISQCFANNAPAYWIVTDKTWKGNVLAQTDSQEKASLIARAVNEHAALVAVAEATVQLEINIGLLLGLVRSEIPVEIIKHGVTLASVELALANLAAVRNQ